MCFGILRLDGGKTLLVRKQMRKMYYIFLYYCIPFCEL